MNLINKKNLFKSSPAISLRVAGQLCSLSFFKSVSNKTTRIFIVVNNLQPVIKILRQLIKHNLLGHFFCVGVA